MTGWRVASNRLTVCCPGLQLFFLLKWESPPKAGECEKGGVASESRSRRYLLLSTVVLPHVRWAFGEHRSRTSKLGAQYTTRAVLVIQRHKL